MCWSIEISAAFGTASLAMALYLRATKRPFGKQALFFYFSAMEFIQLGQWLVVGQCSAGTVAGDFHRCEWGGGVVGLVGRAGARPPAHPRARHPPPPSPPSFLTALAWLHIAGQPLVVNAYLMANKGDVHPDVATLVRRFSWLAFAGMAARLPFALGGVQLNPVAALGTYFNGGAAPAPGAAYDPGHAAAFFPELPPAAAAGSACGMEGLCGQTLCAYQGTKHLAW